MKYKISAEIKNYANNLDNILKEVVNETLDYAYFELMKSMPFRDGNYLNATDIDYAINEDSIIKGCVYNDLMTAKSGKWSRVPLACLLEWGTGIVGEASNTYPHGYPYRQTPWCYYDIYLHMWVTTDGMAARPHWHPTYEKTAIKFEKILGERV